MCEMEKKDARANAEIYSELKQHHTVESQLTFWNILYNIWISFHTESDQDIHLKRFQMYIPEVI